MVMTWLTTTSKEIEDNKWYTTGEIAFDELIPWRPTLKIVVSYASKEYVDIFKPFKKIMGSRARYFIQGKNLKKFIEAVTSNKLEIPFQKPIRNKEKDSSVTKGHVWYSQREILLLNLIPWIHSNYYQLKECMSNHSDILKIKTIQAGKSKRYFVRADSIEELLKLYPDGKMKK